jgi:hypothetical protein
MGYGRWGALAALVAVGAVVGTLRAQDGGPVPMIPSGPVEEVMPAGPMVPVPQPGPAPALVPDGKYFPYGPVEIAASLPQPPRTPVRTFLRHLNIGCYATVHSPGCGSLVSDTTFIFGSCHAFYNEPCVRKPYIAPGPPGYPNHGNCNCGP